MKITDMQLLRGQVEEITMTQFRQSPGDIIAQVQMGKTFRLTKGSKVVAVIAAPEPTAFELGAEVRRVAARSEFRTGPSEPMGQGNPTK